MFERIDSMFNKFVETILAVLTTITALGLMYCSYLVFVDYGITPSVLFHCLSVTAVAAFMFVVIYMSWTQLIQLFRGKSDASTL